jgi:metallophosphoesterase (TIGR00282 family)
MKIIFFGDIVGQPARRALEKIVPQLKKELEPDLILANDENVAHGQGVSQKSLEELVPVGFDYLTTGDHVYVIKDSEAILSDKQYKILRPLNWPGSVAGRGFELITVGTRRLLLVNLIGRVFMRQDFDDPFKKIEELLDDYSLKGKEQGSEAVDAIVIDFHAEATSEKAGLAWFLDGRVSAVLGTHTHVPTADERILPQGTGFISDLGMVGTQDSILGANKDIVIKRFLTQRSFKMEPAQGAIVEVNGVWLETDDKTGLIKKIERVRRLVESE